MDDAEFKDALDTLEQAAYDCGWDVGNGYREARPVHSNALAAARAALIDRWGSKPETIVPCDLAADLIDAFEDTISALALSPDEERVVRTQVSQVIAVPTARS